MAIGSTAASDVPWARRWSIFITSTRAGTMRMPPPTPKRPDRNPAINPTTPARTRLGPGRVGAARTEVDSDGTDELLTKARVSAHEASGHVAGCLLLERGLLV